MRPLFLLLVLAACAGPGAHRLSGSDAAPRPRAGEVLTSNDPLAAETGVKPVEEAHHHQHHDETIDPVCGMKVDPATAAGGSATREGKTYFFCSVGCRKAFEQRGAR